MYPSCAQAPVAATSESERRSVSRVETRVVWWERKRGRRVNDSAPENSEPKRHCLSHRRDRCSRQKLVVTHFAQESYKLVNLSAAAAANRLASLQQKARQLDRHDDRTCDTVSSKTSKEGELAACKTLASLLASRPERRMHDEALSAAHRGVRQSAQGAARAIT